MARNFTVITLDCVSRRATNPLANLNGTDNVAPVRFIVTRDSGIDLNFAFGDKDGWFGGFVELGG